MNTSFLGLMVVVMMISHLQIPVADVMNTSFLGLMVVVMMISHLQIPVAATFCDDNVILRVGHQGVVPCDFGEFDVVGWLNPTKDLETTLPFISLEGSEIHQPASGNEEYSMLPNGSLVIKNVTYSHEKNYTARVYKNGAVFHDEVPVKVYVLPVPAYPVVSGRADQDRVVIHSTNGKASFNCTMDNIRPAVSLEVVSISNMSNGTSMTAIPSTLTNPDGTYNISLDTQLRIGITQPIGIYFLQCRVAGKFAHLFPSVATIDLVHDEQHIIKFPSVNGLDNQQHIVLDVNREGTLTCSIDRAPLNGSLEWKHINNDSSTRVALERQRHYSFDNGDGTYNITSITNYKATSDAIQFVTVKCVVSGKAAQLYPLYTTVELHFPPVDSDSTSNNTSHSKQLLPHSVVLIFAVFVLAATVLCAIYFIFKTRELTKENRALKATLEKESLLKEAVNGAADVTEGKEVEETATPRSQRLMSAC